MLIRLLFETHIKVCLLQLLNIWCMCIIIIFLALGKHRNECTSIHILYISKLYNAVASICSRGTYVLQVYII